MMSGSVTVAVDPGHLELLARIQRLTGGIRPQYVQSCLRQAHRLLRHDDVGHFSTVPPFPNFDAFGVHDFGEVVTVNKCGPWRLRPPTQWAQISLALIQLLDLLVEILGIEIDQRILDVTGCIFLWRADIGMWYRVLWRGSNSSALTFLWAGLSGVAGAFFSSADVYDTRRLAQRNNP
jgi:hypothetical protein